MTIIGYIHICQKGEWRRSFTILINCIKDYGLYDATSCIRIGIVNDEGSLIPDEILQDPKFQIIYIGNSTEYERPTLLHMRNMAHNDNDDTLYYYLHTKGLRHFGTDTELPVLDWIYLMLYWNIERWKLAVKKLEDYNTYGCNFGGNHYSGNFWWAKKEHILKLPTHIDEYYTAPEDWIHSIKDGICCIYNSGHAGHGHYSIRYPKELYENREC